MGSSPRDPLRASAERVFLSDPGAGRQQGSWGIYTPVLPGGLGGGGVHSLALWWALQLCWPDEATRHRTAGAGSGESGWGATMQPPEQRGSRALLRGGRKHLEQPCLQEGSL